MAMLNYPYETNFLKPLPAWPANSSCEAFDGVQIKSSDMELFTATRKAAEYYYNYAHTETCNEIY
jgi:lysosomal Pro-X carboxypeptidase